MILHESLITRKHKCLKDGNDPFILLYKEIGRKTTTNVRIGRIMFYVIIL